MCLRFLSISIRCVYVQHSYFLSVAGWKSMQCKICKQNVKFFFNLAIGQWLRYYARKPFWPRLFTNPCTRPSFRLPLASNFQIIFIHRPNALDFDSGQTRAMFLKVRTTIFELWLVKVFAKSFASNWPYLVFRVKIPT